MSVYDERRRALGLSTIGGDSAPTTQSVNSGSSYDARREELKKKLSTPSTPAPRTNPMPVAQQSKSFFQRMSEYDPQGKFLPGNLDDTWFGQFLKRMNATQNEVRFGVPQEKPNAPLPIAADLIGGAMGFIGGGPGAVGNVGSGLFKVGEKAIQKPLTKAPQIAKTVAGLGAGSAAYEAGTSALNNEPVSAKDIGLAAAENAALGLLPYGVGKGISKGKEAIVANKINRLELPKPNPLQDVQNAYKTSSLRDVRQKELEQVFSGPRFRPDNPSQYFTKTQSDLESAFQPRKLGQYTLTTPLKRAEDSLQKGIQTAQNAIGHNDILAPYSPGTTLQQAFADIKAKTGVDLLKLALDVEKTSKPLPKLTSEQRRLGQVAGVIPQLKPRDVLKPELPERPVNPGPRIWTNKDVEPTKLQQREPISPQPEAQTRSKVNAESANSTAESFRQKINREPAKTRGFLDTVKDLRTQFVDDVAPLERLEKKVTGKVASAEDSLYKQARLFRGSPERANEIIQSRLGPVVKGIEDKGYSYKDLGDYALAVHARDVNAKGIKSGFTDAEIQDVITRYGTPEMEAARQQLIKLNDDMLQELADNGVIEQSLVKTLKEKHPNYMPLFRSFDDDKIEFTKGISKALANVTSPIKKLKGSERDVIDPIESMVKNVFQSVNATDRNKVALQLGKLADVDPEGVFIRRLAEGEDRGRLNTVYAREGGKQVHYEVQPDVYKAIMSLDKESSNFLIKVLQKPASLLRAGATLTPEFSFRNPMRDVVQAFVVSKSGFNPIRDVPGAIVDIVKSKRGKETAFNDFIRANGGYGNIVSMDRKVHQEAVRNIITQPTGKQFVNILSGKALAQFVIRSLRKFADFSETTTKLGEYKAAIRSGVSSQEAAYRARDIMDFGRAGVSIREANKVVAFLNANIQGKSKLLRSIKENPVGVTTRAITSVTLPTLGAFMAQKYLANNEQQKAIKDAPTWLKDTFWLIPVPGTDQVARIPKPFDLAPIFANLPERFMEYIYDNDPNAFDGFAKETLKESSIPVMLTGFMPIVEGMSNYSFFRQGPIIPQREQDLNYPDQYDIDTTETAKFLGKGINKLTGGTGAFKNFGSPRVIDNTIRGTTGGLGQYATSFIDYIAEGTGAVGEKNKPSKGVSQLPIARSFLVNEQLSGQSLNDLYALKDKLSKEKGSAKAQKKPFKEERKLNIVESKAKQISDITKTMRQIENSKTISPDDKRRRLKQLNDQRNKIAIDTMEKLK